MRKPFLFRKKNLELTRHAGPRKILPVRGGVAQLGERRVRNAEVVSSILILSTKIQRPTVLSWAFSFVLPACHAGFPHILRVRPGSCGLAGTSPVALRSALSSLEIGANFFAVAHAHGLLRP